MALAVGALELPSYLGVKSFANFKEAENFYRNPDATFLGASENKSKPNDSPGHVSKVNGLGDLANVPIDVVINNSIWTLDDGQAETGGLCSYKFHQMAGGLSDKGINNSIRTLDDGQAAIRGPSLYTFLYTRAKEIENSNTTLDYDPPAIRGPSLYTVNQMPAAPGDKEIDKAEKMC